MDKKRILFLGASVYFLDAARYAKSQGMYLIAVDINDPPKAVVKEIADESYRISTIDVEALYDLCRKCKVDGIYAGASEVNIPIAIELCGRLGLPYYTNAEQWRMCTNKAVFKDCCVDSGIRVSKTFRYEDRLVEDKIPYPVVTKPVDNNGSTGISICHNRAELEAGYEKAMANSRSHHILIEEFIPSDSVIIQYTIQDGVVKYSGMSDKQSRKINEDGAPVMAVQFFPSVHEEQYLRDVDAKACRMLQKAGMRYGAVWIESFYHQGEFIFNEIGYRYGGSLTYYPVEFFYGINQMNLLVHHAVTGEGLYPDFADAKKRDDGMQYAILPIQIHPCTICEIRGMDEVMAMDGVYRFVQSHSVGNTIPNSGTTLQVFGYLHVIGRDKAAMEQTMRDVKKTIQVLDENGNNQLFTIWEI